MTVRDSRFWLALSVLGLALVAGIVTVSAGPNGQGDPPNLGAEYKSSNFCNLCHTQDETWHVTAHAQLVQQGSAENITGDLSDTDALTITWPDGDERAIEADDITYVLGGRYVERYVSVIEHDDGTSNFYVLPVQWNVPQSDEQSGFWSEYQVDEWQAPERDWRVACAGCHTTGLDGATAAEHSNFAFLDEWVPGDVELNVGCESCHGPGGVHMGDAGTMVVSLDSQVCGQCHINGQNPDSDHAYPIGYQPGLDLKDTGFETVAADDEAAWWPTGHARVYNQYTEWLSSGHGSGMAATQGECARCHATKSSDSELVTGGVTCVACHTPHGEEAPQSDYELCVSCHNSQSSEGGVLQVMARYHHPAQEMFEGWSVVNTVTAIPSGHLMNEAGPRCATCHMPKTVEIGEYGFTASHSMLVALPGETADIQPDSCTGCHAEYITQDAIQRYITDIQSSTEARLAAIDEALDGDSADWVVTVVDFINGDGSRGVHNPAYVNELLDAVEVELGLVEPVITTPSPEILGVEPVQQEEVPDDAEEATNLSASGLSIPSIVLLGITGLIFLVAAYVFFVREPRDD